MEQSDRSRKTFIAILAFLILLHIILIASSRLYPFTDMPNHLAAATIYRHHDDPGSRFSEYYRHALLMKPNTFHTIFCSLPLFPSVESANRVFLSLYAALLPLSVLLLIRRLGGREWFALLSFLVLYNYNLGWGFVGFAFSIPLVLFLLAFTASFLGDGGAWNGTAVAVGLVLLFFVHALAAVFAVLLFLACCIISGRRSPAGKVRACAVLFPLLFIILLWWRRETALYRGTGTVDFLHTYYGTEYLKTLFARKNFLFLDNYNLYEGMKGKVIGLLFASCIVAPAIALLARRRSFGAYRRSEPGRISFAFVALSLACFVLLPNLLPGQAILYQRFSVLVLISLIILGSTLAHKAPHIVFRAGVCAVCLVHLVLWADYITGFNRENAAFTPSFLPEGREGKLAGLIYDLRYRGKPAYIHFPNYFIVWKKGVASTKIVDYRFGAIRRLVGPVELPPYEEWISLDRGSTDTYRGMDYLLVRGFPRPGQEGSLAGFEAARAKGVWALYERTNAPGKH